MDYRAEHDDALSCGSYCPRWFIVRTHYGEEVEAAGQIVNQGFTAYLPEHVAEPTRGKRAQRDNVVVDSAGHVGRRLPLFPRYLFVWLDPAVDQWRPICSTRGVERIFGATPESPTPVPYGVVEELLARPEISAVFRPIKLDGMLVRVTSGPWSMVESGFREGICKWSTDKRVGVLMQLFGGEKVVPVLRSEIEVV